MTFLAWVDYSNMMLCVSKNESGFVCEKYTSGTKVNGAIKQLDSIIELETFLLSFPHAPEKYIKKLILKIGETP